MLNPKKQQFIYLNSISVDQWVCDTDSSFFRTGGPYSLDSLTYPEVQTCPSHRNLVLPDFLRTLLHEPDKQPIRVDLLRLVFS